MDNKLIGTNNIKSQNVSKNKNYDNNKNIYIVNNRYNNNNYIQKDNSSSSQNKIFNNNYIKIDSLKLKNINKNLTIKDSTKKIPFNNQRMIYTPSITKNNNESSLNNTINYKYSSNNNLLRINDYSKDKIISRGLYSNRDSNLTMPIRVNYNLNDSKGKIHKEYNVYESKLNNYIKESNNSLLNKNIYQNIKNKKKYNNVINKSDLNVKYSNYTSRRDNNASYTKISQNTVRPVLKSGVTTVIQHYSGKRWQYDEFNKNRFKK